MANTTGEQVRGRQCLNRIDGLYKKDADRRNPKGQDPNNLSESVTVTIGHHSSDFLTVSHNTINR